MIETGMVLELVPNIRNGNRIKAEFIFGIQIKSRMRLNIESKVGIKFELESYSNSKYNSNVLWL